MVEYIAGFIGTMIALRVSRKLYRKHLSPKLKGAWGEHLVNRTLRVLEKQGSVRLHDLLLPTGRDSTQLDHVVVTNHGVFTIESKNYSGLIVGNEWEGQWQRLSGTAMHTIPNPVRQNYKHTLALKHVLQDFPDVPIYSIVVFSNKTQLDVSAQKALVVHRSDLLSAIASFDEGVQLDDARVRAIGQCLRNANIRDRKLRRRHLQQVKLKSELFSMPELSKAFAQGRDSPIIQFSPEQTPTERILRQSLQSFQENGPCLTIGGYTDTIGMFLHNARRAPDGAVAEEGQTFDHMVCPYTGDCFPPSELQNLERGLWLSYFNKHPELAHHITTNFGFSEMFPERDKASAVVGAYAKSPGVFTAETKQSAWYQNLAESFRKPSVSSQIENAQTQQQGAEPAEEDGPHRDPAPVR